MKFATCASIFAVACLASSIASAGVTKLVVTSSSIQGDKPIPEKYAYCMRDGKGKTMPAANTSPELAWHGIPTGTKDIAIVMYDADVPVDLADANKEGKVIPENAPRRIFYHWVLIGYPVIPSDIQEGHNKRAIPGIPLFNDYADLSPDKPKYNFAGYDGPCPPFNDAKIHSYHFVVYALDAPIIKGQINKPQEVVEELEKHALAKGEIVGTFSNYVK